MICSNEFLMFDVTAFGFRIKSFSFYSFFPYNYSISDFKSPPIFLKSIESHYLPINLASYRFLGEYLKMMKFFRGVKWWRLLSKNFNIYWFLILLINSFSLFQFLLLVVEVLYTWIHWKSRKVHSKNKLLLQRVFLRMLYFQLIFVMHYWCYLWNLICIF